MLLWLDDFELWPFVPRLKGLPGLILEHSYVKFGDPSCIGFWDIVRKNRQRHTDMRSPCPRLLSNQLLTKKQQQQHCSITDPSTCSVVNFVGGCQQWREDHILAHLPAEQFVGRRVAANERQRPLTMTDAGTVTERQNDWLGQHDRRRTQHQHRTQHRLCICIKLST